MGFPSQIALSIFIVFFVTSVINFVNFMDGVDGLVAGCMFIPIFLVSFSLSRPWPFFALAGSLLGFCIVNWSPAKVFMGDVGSTFLGAVFAGLVLQSSSFHQALGFLLLATPLLADSSLCVLRRFFAGQPVLSAHRLHLFQRLHQAGWTHARVSLTYISASSVLAFAYFLGGLTLVLAVSFIELIFGIWLDCRVAVPFSISSQI